jgi:two-component system invasion response regulator UvrY
MPARWQVRMRAIRVLVADDNEEIRKRVSEVLDQEFEVVGTVPDGVTLVEAALLLEPDVIVSDLCMPRLGGLEARSELLGRGIRIPFVFVSLQNDVTDYLRAAPAAYVHKADLVSELNAALRLAFAGQRFQSSRYRNPA